MRRNRLKRILRELTRLTLMNAVRASRAAPVMDIVMRARPAAYSASHDALRAEFDALRERLLRLPLRKWSEDSVDTPPATGA